MLRPLALVCLVVLAASCGEDSSADAGAVERGKMSGLLTKVEDERLTLAPDNGGAAERFSIRQVDAPRLDLFHLEDHVRRKWPVVVFWEAVDGRRFAYRVDDA